MSDVRQHVHELIDRLPSARLTAVEGLLNAMLDAEDPLADEDIRRFRTGQAWFAEHSGKGIPMEDVLAEFGFTLEDFPIHK